ncbi:MAG: enoyl-CoA hydratase/isomerase family protein [Gluconacetobacter liquefaciens]
MEDPFILTRHEGDIAVITLNRPRILNAWHSPMRDALVAALTEAEADPAIGAVVLTGAGTRAFGAGQDLAESKDFSPARVEAWLEEWFRLYDALRAMTKPLIAALNGLAAGSAFQVALLCDLRIAHPGVTMGQPEIKAGIASVTGPWIMEPIIGRAHTIDLMLTGRMVPAAEAQAMGLVSRLVPQDAVLPEALALATELAALPRGAMAANKRRLREATETGFREVIAAGKRIHRASYESGEPEEMAGQFLSRRKTGPDHEPR